MSRKFILRSVPLLLLLALTGGTPRLSQADESGHRHSHGQRCSAEYGQQLINQRRYEQAIRVYTCIINQEPTGVEGYRGRIEAQLLVGRYSDALRDYSLVAAFVLPVDPDAANTIVSGYDARLAESPNDVPALTGASFAQWWLFEYGTAIRLLNRLVNVKPNDVYGNLFRGSSRLLSGVTKKKGIADLEFAIARAPCSADVRFIVADAYTYGQPDPARAFAEASRALDWGLDTPRIHAILASAYLAFGDEAAAAAHIHRHIELVTTDYETTTPLNAGASMTLLFIPGVTYELPVPAIAGEWLSINTSSLDFYDSILVLLAPDGTPIVGGDDYDDYFAGFEWTVPTSGTYRLLVTSFESISMGELTVTRD